MISDQDLQSLVNAIRETGHHFDLNDIDIQTLNPGVNSHIQTSLPRNKMAVYIFFHNEQPLKVGKVNIGSNPRYQYQHYSPNSNGSVLAKSLLSSDHFRGLIHQAEIKNWMKENLLRVNILIPANYHRNILHFIEAFFILKFDPLFENGT